MNKLSEAIQEAVAECLETGNSYIEVDKIVDVSAEWESWDLNEIYDIVTVYIYENRLIKFRYQIVETRTSR